MFPPWNDALDAQLRKLLVDEGLTAKQASAVMKRPAGGINLRARKIGIVRLARQDWDDTSETRLRELFAAGLTAEAMAHAMKRPIGSIQWKLNDLKLKRGRGTPTIGLRPAPALRPKPVQAAVATARTAARAASPSVRTAPTRAPPAKRIPIDRAAARSAAEADRAKARTAAAQATRDADAILAEARRAEREAKRRAAAETRATQAAAREAAKAAKAAAAEAKRREREEAARLREVTKAEDRLRKEKEREEARRRDEAAKAEKREREEQAARVAQAIAAAEGRGGNVAGAIVRRVVPKRSAKVTTREDAISVRNSAADAIARFLAERGATRVVLDPVEEAVTGLRRKGYAMTRDGDAWVVDGRHRLAGFAELRDFAARRGVDVSAFLQAAE